jgi:hypothetical protein
VKWFVLALVIGIVSIAAVSIIPPGAKANPLTQSRDQPVDVAKAYLQASYARDFATAYRFISAIDRPSETKRLIFGRREILTVSPLSSPGSSPPKWKFGSSTKK